MIKKVAKLTAIMLVQQLEDEHWKTWDNITSIKLAREGNIQPLLKAVIDKLNKADIPVSEAYGIKHDQDKVSTWNQELMRNVIEKKADHVHFLFKFERGASLTKIALSIGIEPQYLEKLKSGRYGYDNCLAYLIHAKDETKYQYNPNEVITVIGEDYSSIYNRNIETWIKGRATKKAKETYLSIDWLIEKILAGEITKSNILLTDEYYEIYGRHKRKINEALDTAGERKSFQAISDLEKGSFKKTVLYVLADSGVGKTKFSMELIHKLQSIVKENYGYELTYCLTASKNAFDEYQGQDILFLDDIRGDSLSVSDWLKLTDPYMISPISARYHNKLGSAKIIIITNTLLPSTFFSQANVNNKEDDGQFIRRFDYQVHIPKHNKFILSEPKRNEYLDGLEITGTFHSYSFSTSSKILDKSEAMTKIIKKILANINLKSKKVIADTKQNNRDNLLINKNRNN